MSRQILRRIAEIRSVPEALQVVRYVQRKLPMRFVRKPAIIKDPFLLFSAPALQRLSGIKIVLTVRHPCAFVESFTRAGHGFDFANFLQPELLATMPAEAHAITQMASSPSRLIEQAALLWRVLYGFADTYLIGNPSTFVVRQEELVRKTDETIARLFIFSGASQTEKIRRFVGRNFSADTADFARSGSYFRRDSAKVLEKWHGRLTEDEVLVIRTATEPLASKLGYGAESWSPASTPSL
ncbi:MAG: hypothetical protein WAT93_14645 [Pontixanthobacter sp.]